MRFPIPEGYHVVYRYVPVQAKRAPKGWQPKFSDPYSHLPAPMTTATMALIFADDAPGGVPVAVGVAILNPTDNFSRRIGRDIARGRAAKTLAERQLVSAAPTPEFGPDD